MGVPFKFLSNFQFQLKFKNNNDDVGKDNKDDNSDDQDNRQRSAIHEHLLEFLKLYALNVCSSAKD